MSIEKGKHFPIFLILTEGSSPIISKSIKKVTNCSFSHASISFDPTLKDIYSFSILGPNRTRGFVKENLFWLAQGHNNNKIAVFTFFVSAATKRKIMSSFYDFEKHKDESTYSFKRLVLKLFDKGKEHFKYSQVCSSFVAAVLYNAGINIAPSNIYLISPADIHKGIEENKTIYPLYYGHVYSFDAAKIKGKLNMLYDNEKTDSFKNIYKEDFDDFKISMDYINYKNRCIKNHQPYMSKNEYIEAKKKAVILRKKLTNKAKKSIEKNNHFTKIFKEDEEIITRTPDMVDRSNYHHFKLFNLFDIYTTDEDLETNEFFIKNMKWVKEKLEKIAKECDKPLQPYELTLCASFEDLDEFYDHQAPKWVTGFTWGNQVYMKAPNIYEGTLYYNIVLHEAIHVFLFNNYKLDGYTISRKDEEGMAVYFSTPLKEWLRELNHGPNWYYYESAIEVQEDYLIDGMKRVLKKRLKKGNS